MNKEKSERNEKGKEVIMKGLSNLDVDKLRHCETTREMLGILQFLYG